jgi:uncharacterized membrane protein
MTKIGFLLALRDQLKGLPQNELEERLSFYSEMIEDRMEDGLTEEEAVADIGSVDEIAAQIVSEVPLSSLFKEKIKPKRALRTWEIVLLAVGSPIWFSLVVTAFAVAFSLYAALWAVVAAFWATFGGMAAGAVGALVGGTLFAVLGNVLPGLACFAAALVLAGLSIFAFFGCRAVTVFAVYMSKKMALGIKLCFVKGGR